MGDDKAIFSPDRGMVMYQAEGAVWVKDLGGRGACVIGGRSSLRTRGVIRYTGMEFRPSEAAKLVEAV